MHEKCVFAQILLKKKCAMGKKKLLDSYHRHPKIWEKPNLDPFCRNKYNYSVTWKWTISRREKL